MKTKIQKTLLATLIISICAMQIGCAEKSLIVPLQRAQFDPNYSYTIKTTQETELKDIPGTNIQNLPDRLHITQNNQTKYLLHNQVKNIDGESYRRTGSYVVLGLSAGAAVGTLIGLVPAIAINLDNCSDDCDLLFLVTPLFTAMGAALGAGIGALIPKKSKIIITPSIAPSQHGINAGGSVSFKF